MTETPNELTDDAISVDEWRAIRKRAALEIDPLTAEVMWMYAQTLDPYGVERNLPDEYKCLGREYFARNPGGDIWVSYQDLPGEAVTRLRASGRERRALEGRPRSSS